MLRHTEISLCVCVCMHTHVQMYMCACDGNACLSEIPSKMRGTEMQMITSPLGTEVTFLFLILREKLEARLSSPPVVCLHGRLLAINALTLFYFDSSERFKGW